MTVKELRAILAVLPDDLLVVVPVKSEGYSDIKELKQINIWYGDRLDGDLCYDEKGQHAWADKAYDGTSPALCLYPHE